MTMRSVLAAAAILLGAAPAMAQNNVRLTYSGLTARGVFCVDAQNLSPFASPGSINRTLPAGSTPVGDVVVRQANLAALGQPGDLQRFSITPTAPGAQNAFIFVQQQTRVSNEILTNDRTVCGAAIPPILLPPPVGGGGGAGGGTGGGTGGAGGGSGGGSDGVVITALPAEVSGLQRNVARFTADSVFNGAYQISDEIAFGFARPAGQGPVPGPEGWRWNAWVSPRAVGVRNSAPGTTVSSDVYELIGGIDYRVTDDLIIGLALGGDRQDGAGKDYGLSLNRNGWFAGPYLGWRLRPTTILDVWAGGGRADQEVEVPGERGSYGTDRWFLSANLTEIVDLGFAELRPRLSYQYAKDSAAGFTSTTGVRYLSDSWAQSLVSASVGISRPVAVGDGVLRPFMRLGVTYGLDLPVTQGARIDGTTYDVPRWSGQVRAGVAWRVAPGVELGLQAGYLSAFVSDVQAWEGRALLTVLF